MTQTRSESHFEATEAPPVPGALVVFAAEAPLYRCVPLMGQLTLGRGLSPVPLPDDDRVSQKHLQLSFDGTTFTVTDLGSRNGTFVQGERITGSVKAKPGTVVRMGHTLMVLHADLRPYQADYVTVDDFVVGPKLKAVLDKASMVRSLGANLLIHGETGAGKELVAARYRGGRTVPFVPVNCAEVQPTLAERLMFGAVKGAYNDARDADGYFISADGGVLFLDEVAELHEDVQAKLLRALESGTVMRIGATQPVKVKVNVCSASHVSLRDAVKAGAFRQDLYFRLAGETVSLPPLRERLEEIPFLMHKALAGRAGLHATAVELAMVRPWPGNVRELLSATSRAATTALEDDPPRTQVRSSHFDAHAGQVLASEAVATVPAPAAPSSQVKRHKTFTREELEALLKRNHGNISAAAREVELHRTQLVRELKQHGLQGADSGPSES